MCQTVSWIWSLQELHATYSDVGRNSTSGMSGYRYLSHFANKRTGLRGSLTGWQFTPSVVDCWQGTRQVTFMMAFARSLSPSLTSTAGLITVGFYSLFANSIVNHESHCSIWLPQIPSDTRSSTSCSRRVNTVSRRIQCVFSLLTRYDHLSIR